MDFQIDPFASVVSVIAVVVSVLAYRVAKHAPLDDRRRSYRDEARSALLEAIEFIALEVEEIKAKKPIDRAPYPIVRARSALQDVAPRLPESVRLTALGTKCTIAISKWDEVLECTLEASNAAVREKSARDRVVHLAGQSSPAKAEELRDEYRAAQKITEAAEADLRTARESLIETMFLIRRDAAKYVAEVDEKERRRRSR